MRRGSCAVIIAALALTTGCAAQDPEPPQLEQLTASAAGGVYLDAVCPVNTAWDNVDLELDRLRLGLHRGTTDTQDFASALKKMAVASEEAAKFLAPKDYTWPKVAKAPVAEVRETLLADKQQVPKILKLSAKEAVIYEWSGRDRIAQSAADARVALGLPADPELACAQWVEQQNAEKSDSGAKDLSD